MSQWIKCSEGLPVSGQPVLGVIGQNVAVVVRVRDGWRDMALDAEYVVTHWMALPTPPKRQSSFEQWWNSFDMIDDNEIKRWVPQVSASVWKGHAQVIWDAAVSAAKGPDFVP